jgi:opacity protein-like surface antigen
MRCALLALCVCVPSLASAQEAGKSSTGAALTPEEQAERDRWTAWLGSKSGGPPPEFRGEHARPAPRNGWGSWIGTSTCTLSVLYGMRNFDDDIEPVDEHPFLGLELDTYDPDAWLGFECGLSIWGDHADVAGSDLDASAVEVSAGLRHAWSLGDRGNTRPYVSAGLTFLDGDVEVSSGGSVADEDLGTYLRAGVYWQTSKGLRFGVDYRHTYGLDFQAPGPDLDADFEQVAFVIGKSF